MADQQDNKPPSPYLDGAGARLRLGQRVGRQVMCQREAELAPLEPGGAQGRGARPERQQLGALLGRERVDGPPEPDGRALQ